MMSNSTRIYYILGLLSALFVLPAKAQQDPLLGHYMYNTLALNPAYAGTAGLGGHLQLTPSFGFIWYQSGSSGYFVSNRPGGKGQDDLYAFESSRGLNLVLIQGKVLNEESGEPEAAVDIQVLLPNQGSYQQTVSAEDGSFSLLLWGDTSYTFTFNKEGFMRQQKSGAARALSLPVVLTPVITEQPEIPEETETPKDSLLHLNNQWF